MLLFSNALDKSSQFEGVSTKDETIDAQKHIQHGERGAFVAIDKWLILGNAHGHQHSLANQVGIFVIGSRLSAHERRFEQALIS